MKPRYIEEAEALLGEKEVKGKLANDKIKELYADAGHPSVISDEVPWCAAYVGACLVRANKPSTGTLLARDYLTYGAKLKGPKLYSIGVMRRGTSSWEGHVGFVVDFNDTHVWLLGGNQRDSVNVSKYPRSQFLGFVVPKEDEADVSEQQLIKDSRRLTTQTWGERTLATLGVGGAISWQTLEQVRSFATDNAGLLILGGLGTVWLGSRLIKWMSYREYKQGRYQPNAQWE